MNDRARLKRYAWLSIAAALSTIALKAGAFLITDSVGLLADALESGVNLVAAVFVLIVLGIAAQPPDEEHAYGHTKAEYFASGAEGALIFIAAITIAITAIRRLADPQPLEQIGLGLIVSIIAAGLNLAVARILLRAGQQYRSITLEADARHLMTDVWTTGGVLIGIAAVAVTGWESLDPIIAILVALQILVAGLKLVRESINGLMDRALPPSEVSEIIAILDRYAIDGVRYHALRTRQSGAQRFMSVHVQVPGAWSVHDGHSLLEDIDRDVRQALTPISVFTHLEPLEDPRSWDDIAINRTN
ncbi:MAG: cation diffusion facilitator family transporter [Chloroflexota bacterium]|jgi:cation diffusion facilitator family transporter